MFHISHVRLSHYFIHIIPILLAIRVRADLRKTCAYVPAIRIGKRNFTFGKKKKYTYTAAHAKWTVYFHGGQETHSKRGRETAKGRSVRVYADNERGCVRIQAGKFFVWPASYSFGSFDAVPP